MKVVEEAAQAGSADCVISGDADIVPTLLRGLFDLAPFEGIPILHPCPLTLAPCLFRRPLAGTGRGPSPSETMSAGMISALLIPLL